jgi:hypothetical protein
LPVVGFQLPDFGQGPDLEDHGVGQARSRFEPQLPLARFGIGLDGDFYQHHLGKLPVGLHLGPGEEQNTRNMGQLSEALIVEIVQQRMVGQFHLRRPR